MHQCNKQATKQIQRIERREEIKRESNQQLKPQKKRNIEKKKKYSKISVGL